MSDNSEFLIKVLNTRVEELVTCLRMIEEYAEKRLQASPLSEAETASTKGPVMAKEMANPVAPEEAETMDYSEYSEEQLIKAAGISKKPYNALSLFHRLQSFSIPETSKRSELWSRCNKSTKEFYRINAKKINSHYDLDKGKEETDHEEQHETAAAVPVEEHEPTSSLAETALPASENSASLANSAPKKARKTENSERTKKKHKKSSQEPKKPEDPAEALLNKHFGFE